MEPVQWLTQCSLSTCHQATHLIKVVPLSWLKNGVAITPPFSARTSTNGSSSTSSISGVGGLKVKVLNVWKSFRFVFDSINFLGVGPKKLKTYSEKSQPEQRACHSAWVGSSSLVCRPGKHFVICFQTGWAGRALEHSTMQQLNTERCGKLGNLLL